MVQLGWANLLCQASSQTAGHRLFFIDWLLLGQVLSVGPTIGDHGGRVSGVKHGPGPNKRNLSMGIFYKRDLDSPRM